MVGGHLGESSLGQAGVAGGQEEQDLARNAFVGAQSRRIDRFGAGGKVLQAADSLVLRTAGDVLVAVVVRVDPQHQRLGRTHLERVLPVLVAQCSERVVHLRSFGRGVGMVGVDASIADAADLVAVGP